MANTKKTPIEALERSFPLRVLRYRLRRGSGGAGRHPGGEGIERDLLVLEDTTVSLITERRASRPWALAGGEPGAPAENWLLPAGDEERAECLPDKCTVPSAPATCCGCSRPAVVGGGRLGDHETGPAARAWRHRRTPTDAPTTPSERALPHRASPVSHRTPGAVGPSSRSGHYIGHRRGSLVPRVAPETTVTTVARDRLATLLREVTAPGSFSAQRTARVDDLHLEVRGVGQVALPVADTQAKSLCRVGRPARYGRGELTLLDPRVRDTWEIPKSRVKLDKREWNKTLLPVLQSLRADLGLPSGCELKAELHSMLVYAPGQFFVPHQDSEKADAMVGSLVVTLPSSFKGGALVVEHGGVTATYRSSKKSISFVAFYADCRHQVQPIKSGYRIVLTYNLLLKGDAAAAAASEAPPGAAEAVARCLDEHFTTPVPLPRGSVDAAPADPPNRLVYLLDHEYTALGSSWSRLKGSDARRAAVLRAAATRADCDIVLALADVRETWSCFETRWERPWYARRRYDRWDDREDDDAWAGEEDPTDHEGYELDELVDWDITLECWVDPSGERVEPAASSVGTNEVCATTLSADLRPYASEYEGYMGNYGNTMDRWYRRAALVVWPRRRAFAVRGEASPTWALDELSKRVRAGDVAEAQEMAATLAPFWNAVAGLEHRRDVLAKAMRVARALDEPLATMLLEPFRVEMLARHHAPALVRLVEAHGERWARDLVDMWSRRRRSWASPADQARREWVASLPRLCEALHAAGSSGTSMARLLAQDSWRRVSEAIEQRRGLMPPSRRDEALGELGRSVLAVLQSTVIADADLRDTAVGFLREGGEDLLPCLMQLLRTAEGLPPTTRTAAGLDALAEHCTGRLEARLARPRRADDDWSIDLPGGCSCELCGVLGDFLTDPARRALDWPLAKERRRHVHGRLDSAELPVRHLTRRAGRPYTLVLTKTEAIFERRRQARRRDEADLAWLYAHQRSSGGPPRPR
ncbi:MAG: hydantoinase B/oxoprolinase family protein [Actinomycetota bacterium]|nr:hydantoinase B/oxoprolinase family protein [Actinomycetota bacterium]